MRNSHSHHELVKQAGSTAHHVFMTQRKGIKSAAVNSSSGVNLSHGRIMPLGALLRL
jgi:hypothetical protein